MSIADTILRRVRARGRGAVFTAQDFADLGARAAVDQALARMAATGAVRRIDRGVYDLPRVHPRLGTLSPVPAAVAQALARQSGGHVQVDGAAAANALGLSTQVPAGSAWITDGRSRSVRIGRLPVVVRHVGAETNPCIGTPAGMAISALQHLGRDHVSEDVVRHLSAVLAPADKRRLDAARPRLPEWLGVAAAQIAAA